MKEEKIMSRYRKAAGALALMTSRISRIRPKYRNKRKIPKRRLRRNMPMQILL